MEERNYRNWEKEEIKVLLRQIRDNEVLRDAFRKTSLLIGRSETACRKKWYDDIRDYKDCLRNDIAIQPMAEPVRCKVMNMIIKIINKLKLKINETFNRTDSKNQGLV